MICSTGPALGSNSSKPDFSVACRAWDESDLTKMSPLFFLGAYNIVRDKPYYAYSCA